MQAPPYLCGVTIARSYGYLLDYEAAQTKSITSLYLTNDHAQHLTGAYLWRGEESGGFVEITHSIELGPGTRCWL